MLWESYYSTCVVPFDWREEERDVTVQLPPVPVCEPCMYICFHASEVPGQHCFLLPSFIRQFFCTWHQMLELCSAVQYSIGCGADVLCM
uniref:Uncharacterized protein n=1 Tax=Setaria viridis TaxID=4556 RepID=A0A4U6W535_SETVI|nr:hypothetical protein SEVIR_1G061600v2 [Setaria viridis]